MSYLDDPYKNIKIDLFLERNIYEIHGKMSVSLINYNKILCNYFLLLHCNNLRKIALLN